MSARVLVLPGEVRRKLFVDRKAAAHLRLPIIVEDPNGERHYARHVRFVDKPCEPHHTEFKWSGNNNDAPALWIETEAELELTY